MDDLDFLKFWDLQTHLPKSDELCVETQTRINQYNILWKLGKGQTASVYSCKKRFFDTNGDIQDTTEYAVKCISKERINAFDKRRIIRSISRIDTEINILNELKGKSYICNMHDVIHSPNYVYIVMDLASYDLYDYIHDDYTVYEHEAKHIFTQVSHAIEHCHNNNIAHRDIKPENILITGSERLTCRIMLCDFGMAVKLPPHNSKMGDFVGSPGFVAPELVSGQKYCCYAADIWSIGCLLLEMLLGHAHFNTNWTNIYKDKLRDYVTLYRELMETVVKLDPILFKHTGRGESLRSLLINSILIIDPTKRISINEINQSNWIIGSKNISPNTPCMRKKKPILDLTNDTNFSALSLKPTPPSEKTPVALGTHNAKHYFNETNNKNTCEIIDELSRKLNETFEETSIPTANSMNNMKEFAEKLEKREASGAKRDVLSGPTNTHNTNETTNLHNPKSVNFNIPFVTSMPNIQTHVSRPQ